MKPKIKEKLEDVEHAFQRWRRAKSPGERIPDGLWAQAATAAKIHGMTVTAHALSLNHSHLKQRCEALLPTPTRTSEFVEFPAAGLLFGGHESLVEVEDASGFRVRLVLRGVSAAEAAAAAKVLWSAPR